jgi:hypothetical protein
MYCPSCAKENADNARFCRRCGQGLGLVPDAVAGRISEREGRLAWWRMSILMLLSLFIGPMIGTFLASLHPRFGLAALCELFGAICLFGGALAGAYFQTSPSILIAKRSEVRQFLSGAALLFGGAGAFIAASALAPEVSSWGLAMLALFGVASLTMMVPAGVAVGRAQYRAWKETLEDDEEEDEEEEEEDADAASTTDRLTEKHAAWQLEPPPSVVDVEPETDGDVVIPPDARRARE